MRQITVMSRHKTTTLVLAAFGSLLAGTGCTRTSDGSVVMKTPPSMPKLFASRPEQPALDQTVMLTQLPPPETAAAPATAAAPVSRRAHTHAMPSVSGWKMQTVKAPFERSDPEKPLNCRNETSPQGRVKVVCE